MTELGSEASRPGAEAERSAGGVRFMIAGAFFFAVMAACAKVAGKRLPTQEVVLARGIITSLLSYAALRRLKVAPLGQDRARLALRGLLGFGGFSCYFFALSELRLADATVIQFTSPVFTALLAALLLREGVGAREMLGTGLSLTGVVLVARPSVLFGGGPGYEPLSLLVAISGAIFAAGAYVTVRSLRRTDHPLVIVLWAGMAAIVGSLPLVVPVFRWPEGWDWAALAGVGIATQLGQWNLTKGLHLERAGKAMSITYLQVVFAFAFGMAFFEEYPDALGLAGAGLVLVGTLIVAGRRGPS